MNVEAQSIDFKNLVKGNGIICPLGFGNSFVYFDKNDFLQNGSIPGINEIPPVNVPPQINETQQVNIAQSINTIPYLPQVEINNQITPKNPLTKEGINKKSKPQHYAATCQILELFQRNNLLTLEYVANYCKVDKRRIYDIMNVLEYYKMITKLPKNGNEVYYKFCSEHTTCMPLDVSLLSQLNLNIPES
ncbi:hypothetical protein TRFO_01143 [Tritrichomonas foetus]|uniref:E2F/DP family winged-helix DNA-binding domain-containing protein n=1 Tax=Tritrichomonas foetus TaxID=1144522 RepID=A0A1J4KIP6_9EUKA|nr:hypothetical protein TRFO_01143 [Tritrichomonas foetus]|eukprot:OHT11207.1 hypothetical protein TRFO_01143 [Tritrichomonas foetus]